MKRSRRGSAALAAGIVLAVWCGGGLAHAQPQPPEEAHLRYHLVQRVDQGHGEYVGWSDLLVSVGDYETHGGHVHAHYDWRYAATDRHRQGAETRDVSFSTVTRDYMGGTDLDDYDDVPGPLATWLWISPEVAAGDTVRVLESTLTVLDRETVRVAGASREAIHLQNRAETGHRDDDYGQFAWTATDDYWFDAATGMFLRQTRIESDRGTYEGASAGFRMSLSVEVVDASYAPAVGPIPAPPEVEVAVGEDEGSADADANDPFASVCLLLFSISFIVLFWGAIRGSANRGGAGALPYTTRRIEPGQRVPAEAIGLSPYFGPFLPHLVDVAHRTGNAVVAVTPVGSPTVVGLAIDDADVKLAAIYTSTADAAEALRRALSRDELVAETRYPTLSTVREALGVAGKSAPSPHAYNLYESFDVMEKLGPLEPLSYDSTVVSRMKAEDVAGAAELALRVYGVPCDGFVRASFELGDVAFVARGEEGEIIGFAFATVAGDRARLHMLTVDPDARSRGVGKELYRARLRALADLGVTRVMTEVAQHNPAAIEVARQFGMQKVGEMHVQTARAQAEPSFAAVRR